MPVRIHLFAEDIILIASQRNSTRGRQMDSSSRCDAPVPLVWILRGSPKIEYHAETELKILIFCLDI